MTAHTGSESYPQKRRSTRIAHAVPITVTGIDIAGQPFKELTETLTVNGHGCRYSSNHFVPKNSIVTLEIPRSRPSLPAHSVSARVVWVQRPHSVREKFAIALEFESAGNTWDVAFPPKDWLAPSNEAREFVSVRAEQLLVEVLDESARVTPESSYEDTVDHRGLIEPFTGGGRTGVDAKRPRSVAKKTNSKLQYEVALSFAGEDREYVEQTAKALKCKGIRAFYDRYEVAMLWGKDLYAHLDDIYRQRSNYTVMFISKHYAKKLWTNHERKSAQARAFKESKEYILPARFDDTEVPGLLPTVGYVDLRNTSPSQLADLIVEKLRLS